MLWNCSSVSQDPFFLWTSWMSSRSLIPHGPASRILSVLFLLLLSSSIITFSFICISRVSSLVISSSCPISLFIRSLTPHDSFAWSLSWSYSRTLQPSRQLLYLRLSGQSFELGTDFVLDQKFFKLLIGFRSYPYSFAAIYADWNLYERKILFFSWFFGFVVIVLSSLSFFLLARVWILHLNSIFWFSKRKINKSNNI